MKVRRTVVYECLCLHNKREWQTGYDASVVMTPSSTMLSKRIRKFGIYNAVFQSDYNNVLMHIIIHDIGNGEPVCMIPSKEFNANFRILRTINTYNDIYK